VEIAGGSGGPTCLDGTPFTPPGLGSCGKASENPVTPPPDAGTPPADAGMFGVGDRDAGAAPREAGARADAAPVSPDLGSGGEGGAGGAGGGPADREPTTPPPGSSSLTSSPGCHCGLGGTSRAPAGLPVALVLGALGMRRLRRRS
jgi:hypothetical protein